MSSLAPTAGGANRRSLISRGLALAIAVASLGSPAFAAGQAEPQDPPRGINGATNDSGQRPERPPAPPATSADEGFSWEDASIGAGAVAGLVAVTGAGLAIRRRHQSPPKPAV